MRCIVRRRSPTSGVRQRRLRSIRKTPAKLTSTTFFCKNNIIFSSKSQSADRRSHHTRWVVAELAITVRRHKIVYDKPTIPLTKRRNTVKRYCLNLRTGRENVRTANDDGNDRRAHGERERGTDEKHARTTVDR